MKNKRYIIHKYIMAKSAKEAIQKEVKEPVDSVFVDDDWLNEDTKQSVGYAYKDK